MRHVVAVLNSVSIAQLFEISEKAGPTTLVYRDVFGMPISSDCANLVDAAKQLKQKLPAGVHEFVQYYDVTSGGPPVIRCRLFSLEH